MVVVECFSLQIDNNSTEIVCKHIKNEGPERAWALWLGLCGYNLLEEEVTEVTHLYCEKQK